MNWLTQLFGGAASRSQKLTDKIMRGDIQDIRTGDAAAIEAARRLLRTGYPDEIDRAMYALREFGVYEAIFAEMIGRLMDEDYDVRDKAAKVLGRIGDRRALEPLISALNDEYRGVRNRGPVYSGVTTTMDMNQYTRRAMVKALGQLGDAKALDVLKRASKDSEISVQKEARAIIQEIESGGELRKKSPQHEEIERLIQELKKANSETRQEAKVAIEDALKQLLIAEPTASSNGRLERLLSPMLSSSAVLRFCGCGYPSKCLFGDGSWGPFFEIVDCDCEGDVQHYKCPNCGAHIKTLAAP